MKTEMVERPITTDATLETGMLERCGGCGRRGPAVMEAVERDDAVVWMRCVQAWLCMSCLDEWVGVFPRRDLAVPEQNGVSHGGR